MKTEAAILVDTAKPLVLVEMELPTLKPGQVLVEVTYSGACHTQVLEARGHRGEDKWLPHCLGHEGTGKVLEIGAGVSKVAPDDKVVLSWIKGTGIEAGGAVYQWNGQNVNAGGVTTFQRHAVVSENRLTALPDTLPEHLSILLGCAAPTGMGAILNVAQVRPGDAVAIFGTGGVGLNACMAAAFSGGMPVIGIDPVASRREFALKFGATHVIDPADGEVLEQVRAIVPGGVDIAIEATGIPSVMSDAVNSTRQQGGRAVVIGNAKHGQELILQPGVFNQGKSLMGTWGGDSVPDRDYGRFAKLLASERFPAESLLSDAYSLASADQALTDLEAGTIGRPLIDMSIR
jgi:S-(hydroxymethyl)glutathione dehydrogenase / alcohol dehydrogenase